MWSGVSCDHRNHASPFVRTEMVDFYPTAPEGHTLPTGTPDALRQEMREAELAAGAGAFRAASDALRTALEKTLKQNGYRKGSLQDKIEAAARDGLITQARKRRAHEDVRVFANDIVHDDWREVSSEDYEVARQYVTWILRDFYDDRETVERQLENAGRLASEETGSSESTRPHCRTRITAPPSSSACSAQASILHSLPAPSMNRPRATMGSRQWAACPTPL
jgi:Arc/MetJ-type ribon-helix-helix transcriptional regulator